MALNHVLREEAAEAQLGNVQCQCADEGGERPLAVTVSAVRSAAAQLLGEGLSSSCMSMAPSSKRGMASMSGTGSDKISIAFFVLS